MTIRGSPHTTVPTLAAKTMSRYPACENGSVRSPPAMRHSPREPAGLKTLFRTVALGWPQKCRMRCYSRGTWGAARAIGPRLTVFGSRHNLSRAGGQRAHSHLSLETR